MEPIATHRNWTASEADRTAQQFLQNLFTGCKALSDANPEIYTSEKNFRGTNHAGGRTGYFLTKCYRSGEEELRLTSNGVNYRQLFAMMDQLTAAVGESPKKISATKEGGQSIPIENEATRGDIAHFR